MPRNPWRPLPRSPCCTCDLNSRAASRSWPTFQRHQRELVGARVHMWLVTKAVVAVPLRRGRGETAEPIGCSNSTGGGFPGMQGFDNKARPELCRSTLLDPCSCWPYPKPQPLLTGAIPRLRRLAVGRLRPEGVRWRPNRSEYLACACRAPQHQLPTVKGIVPEPPAQPRAGANRWGTCQPPSKREQRLLQLPCRPRFQRRRKPQVCRLLALPPPEELLQSKTLRRHYDPILQNVHFTSNDAEGHKQLP
jgi:hypothetical protein